ncbi:MAG: chorismate pyruvate-lyase family protein [Chromatiaceae bacterium]|nr:chorismate pyruvate-lyase family protein [Chromatiaceae bacterium]
MVRRYYDKTEDAGDRNPFRCQGFLRDAVIRGECGPDVPLQELPPFLRALLVTDGTVTKILEAYFWEPVEVVTLAQEFVYAERPIDWIRIKIGDRVLIRRARLSGMDSGDAYATAFSVIRTELIPDGFRQRLIDREIGIGVLIRDSGMESYREVLEVGIEPPSGRDDLEALEKSELIFRTYRIIIDGEPVILITESFPLALYSES